MSNIFGGNTGTTYEQLQRQRKVADALKAQSLGRTPRNVGEGLTAIGNALAARSIDKKNEKRAAELKSQYGGVTDEIMAALAGGGMGGGSQSAPSNYMPGPNQGIADDAMTALGQPTGGNKEEFINQMWPHAQRVAEQTGLDPRLVIAQAAQETGWGKSAPNNNFFGIKSHGKGGGANLSTQENINGQNVTMQQNFRQYDGMGQSADDYAQFLQTNPRYKQMLSAGDLDGQIAALGQSGYATDPNYAQSVGSIARSISAPTGQQSQGQQGGDYGLIMKASQILSAPDEFVPPGMKMAAQALLQRQLAGSDPMKQLDLEYKQAQLDALRSPTAKPTSTMQEYEFARTQGYEGSFSDYQKGLKAAGRSTNTVNVGNGEVGTIPQGYELFTDPESGARRMRPIPGGPEDSTKQDAVAQQNKDRSGGVVTADVDRALGIIEKSPGWTTGLGASLAKVPGTQARSLAGLLQTIKANVGFDRLQQMRDASVTGGALGAINKTEMDLLQSVLGNLEQSLDAEDLARNLKRVNDIYLEIIHGPGATAPDSGAPQAGKRLRYNPETGELE